MTTDNLSEEIGSAESRSSQGGERDLDNTPGSQLHRARENAGLSREELSRRLCMTVDKLEQLEEDDYERLPGALYVRGYLRNACKELGMDPAPVLESFSGYAAAEEESRAIVEYVRRGPVIDNRPKRNLRGLALLPLIAVAGIFWWVNGRDLTPPAVTEAAVDSAVEEGGAVVEEAPAESSEFATAVAAEPGEHGDLAAEDPGAQEIGGDLAAADDAAGLSEESAVAPAAVSLAAEEPAEGIAETEPAGETTEEIAAVDPASEPAPAAAGDTLQLSFAEESWVEVKDAAGSVLVAKLQPAGSEVAVEGEAPFRLMLGNAAGTEVRFRGELVDSDPIGSRRTRKLTVGE